MEGREFETRLTNRVSELEKIVRTIAIAVKEIAEINHSFFISKTQNQQILEDMKTILTNLDEELKEKREIEDCNTADYHGFKVRV